MRKYKINLADLSGPSATLSRLVSILQENATTRDLVPPPLQLLRDFFQTYISQLNDDKLSPWIKQSDLIEFGESRRLVSRPLQLLFAHQNLEAFHPNPSENKDHDAVEVMLFMQTLLDKEMTKRKWRVEQNLSKLKKPSVLYRREFLVPGRGPRKSYGNPDAPADHSKLIERVMENAFVEPLSENQKKQIRGYIEGNIDLETAVGSFHFGGDARMIKSILVSMRLAAKYNLDLSVINRIRDYLENMESSEPSGQTGVILEEAKKLMGSSGVIEASAREALSTLDFTFVNPRELGVEQRSEDSAQKAPGGIDLNPGMVDFTIQQQGKGLKLPAYKPLDSNISFDGINPVITHVVPIHNLQEVLGIK
jgi:hypothetical protein